MPISPININPTKAYEGAEKAAEVAMHRIQAQLEKLPAVKPSPTFNSEMERIAKMPMKKPASAADTFPHLYDTNLAYVSGKTADEIKALKADQAISLYGFN